MGRIRRRYAIDIGKADEGVVDFSTLVWDYALPVVKDGSRGKGFMPTILDSGRINEARDHALQRLDLLSLVRIAFLQESIRKYEVQWGVPRIPECPREIQEGVRVIRAENYSPMDKLMFIISGATLHRDH